MDGEYRLPLIRDSNGRLIARLEDLRDEHEANGNLMSAAPELLTIAKRHHKLFPSPESQAAIAKAEGRNNYKGTNEDIFFS